MERYPRAAACADVRCWNIVKNAIVDRLFCSFSRAFRSGKSVSAIAIVCVLNVLVAGASLARDADVVAASGETAGSTATESTPSASFGTRRKQLQKLKMATFTKYQARILLPVQYQRKDENNQLTAMGADIPHGIYMFMSMRAPDKVPLNPTAIKPILKGTIEGMKAECETETPLKLGEYEGLECRGKVKVDADVEAIVRGYVADRRMYFVTVMGTGPWIRSSAVKSYLDSFEITP